MTSPLDISVYDDEWLLNPYQFVAVISGQTISNNRPTPAQVQPIGDITGLLITLTIRDLLDSAFTPLVFTTGGSSGSNIVIDDGPNAKFHLNVNMLDLNTADLVARTNNGLGSDLVYSIVLTTSGIPKRMFGGRFNVLQS